MCSCKWQSQRCGAGAVISTCITLFHEKKKYHFERAQRSRNPFYVKSIMLRKHRFVTQHGWAKNNRSHGDVPLRNNSRRQIPFRWNYLPRDNRKRLSKRALPPTCFCRIKPGTCGLRSHTSSSRTQTHTNRWWSSIDAFTIQFPRRRTSGRFNAALYRVSSTKGGGNAANQLACWPVCSPAKTTTSRKMPNRCVERA